MYMSGVKGPDAYITLDEGEALESVGEIVVKKGLDTGVAKAMTEDSKTLAKNFLKGFRISDFNAEFNSEGTPAQGIIDLKDRDETDTDEDVVKEKGKAKYVIGVGFRGTVACLHRTDGCYRGRDLRFKDYELVWDDPPPRNSYTTFCNTCWPKDPPPVNKMDTEASNSDDSDTETSGDHET